jgi:hypothetical protein
MGFFGTCFRCKILATLSGGHCLPYETLVEESELAPPKLPQASRSEQQKTKDNQPERIVEAQGWIRASNGNVLLMAKPVTVTH